MSQVLLVEDQAEDISWLMDLLNGRGYEVTKAANGQEAFEHLDQIHEALQNGASTFQLAIFDVMVATHDLRDLSMLTEDFVEKSKRIGLELCHYAREELEILEQDLPIVCLSALSDQPQVVEELDRLGIPRFNKASQDDTDSIRSYIETNLPMISSLP